MKTNRFKNFLFKKHNKFIMFLIVLFLIIFPICLIFGINKLNKTTNLKTNIHHSTSVSNLMIQRAKNEEVPADVWAPSTFTEMEFKTLMEHGAPEPTNITLLMEWCYDLGVSPTAKLSSNAFVAPSLLNPEFNWTKVGKASITQFQSFITFFGKDGGLHNYTSITFLDVGINFNDPKFWTSLAYYMPNLETITIKSTTQTSATLTKLIKEIGRNSFRNITILNQNIGENYENFLYEDSPLSKTLFNLTINNCSIKDHIAVDSKDSDFYFTDVIFDNCKNLKNLEVLNLNGNELKHVGIHLVCLPSIISLKLANNKISKWHCVDVKGSECYSGLGQLCFPNPANISHVDVSGNELYEIIHIEPKEWTNETLLQYKETQNQNYPSLLNMNISSQHVEKTVFVFGNNQLCGSNTYSDMNVDLSNIFVMPEDLDESSKIAYITNCLKDREKIKQDLQAKENPESWALKSDRWLNLTLTQNVMPSIVDLFGDKSKYYNYDTTSGTTIQDYFVNSSIYTTGVNSFGVLTSTRFYKKDIYNTNPPTREDPSYFSSQTSDVINIGDSKYGAKAYRYCPQSVPGKEYVIQDYLKGVSTTYDTTISTISIIPNFKNKQEGIEIHSSSTYTYNIQVFNDEDFVFYLTPKGELNKYVESISDSDPTVQEIYDNFDQLFTYVGPENKWKLFKDRFNDREYWNIDSVVNNKTTREITVVMTYYVYEYIGSQSESSHQRTYYMKIATSPNTDNRLERVLTMIFLIECGLFVVLLIPLVIFYVRTRIKADQLLAKKYNKISDYQKELEAKAPKIDLKENLTKEKKLTLRERVENSIMNGDNAKTKTVKIDEKDIKVSSGASNVIDVDDILDNL